MVISSKMKNCLCIILILILKKKNIKTRKCKRRYQVHPFNLRRKTHGEYANLISRLEEFPKKYHLYFRMNKNQFDFIHQKVYSDLKPKSTLYRNDIISSKEKLIVTLRFLATGSSFTDLALRFGMGESTVRKCVRKTIDAIVKNVKELFMPQSTTSDWLNIATEFLAVWNFPNCLGAIDGKHVKYFSPRKSGSMNFNYKKTFSTILMACADANYKFIMVSIGAPGSHSDSTVFSSCNFGKLWEQRPDQLNVPKDIPLPGTHTPLPLVLIGDEAFGLKRNLLTPFPGTGLTVKQRIFNYRLSRARRIIESTFGILTHTWRVLLKALEIQPKFGNQVIFSCCILHNFLQNNSENFGTTSGSFTTPLVDVLRMKEPASVAYEIRNKFADWCVEEGNVQFQYTKIY